MITKGDFRRYVTRAYDLSVVDKDKESEQIDTQQYIKTPVYQGRERRRYPRFSRKIKVKYEFKDEVAINPSVNISRGGILIKSKSPVPVNAHLILRIELPDSSEEVIIISRVVWVEKINDADTYLVALSFSSMNSGDNRNFLKFLESLNKQ
jgi:c-di-GMP-binding flagellar brake protein YcgR